MSFKMHGKDIKKFPPTQQSGILLILQHFMYFIIIMIRRRDLKILKSCWCVKPVKFRSAQSQGKGGTEYRCAPTILKQMQLMQTLQMRQFQF